MTTEQSSSSVEAEVSARFADLDLAPQLLDVLTRLNFHIPTPIQVSAIPVGLNGEDIIGIAQTGTGKTLAFGLPIIDRFVRNGNRSRGRALIILPTRELALQVDETMQKVGRPFGLRTSVLIGGAPIRQQLQSLRQNPDVIVATPGRLIDHMQTGSVDLRSADTVVLDEADRMLDMGFAPQIKRILEGVPEERQTMLFSATMPEQIVAIANRYMHKPTRVEIARAGTMAEGVSQELFIVPQEDKNDLLVRLMNEYKGTILVFARTRSRARRVARFIKSTGVTSAEIHADRSLIQRRAALDGFKNGTYRVLVATDIAARGIDVSDIELVLNYDLPDSAEDYVHRIGRTGRAGKKGHAISFAAPDQGSDVRDIEKVIRGEMPISTESKHQFEGGASSSRSRRGRGGGGGFGSQGRPSQPRAGSSSSRPRPASSAPRSDSGSYQGTGGARPMTRGRNFSPSSRNTHSS
jgi:ATP-dependent RNA helicase RhlE